MLINKYKFIEYQGILIPDYPPFVNIDFSQYTKEVKTLLKLRRKYFLLYTTNFDANINYPYWYVIKDEKEDINVYPSKIRYEIRRGLKRSSVLKISKREALDFIRDLYNIYIKAFSRYRNTYYSFMKKHEFIENFSSLDEDLYDIWVVFSKKDKVPIAYALARKEFYETKKTINYSVIKFDPKYSADYPVYALIYEMNRFYLNEQNVLFVNDGRRNIGHNTSIQEWLMKKFKFRKAYTKLNIIYRDDIEILLKLFFNTFYPFVERLPMYNKHFAKLKILFKLEKIRRQCIKLG